VVKFVQAAFDMSSIDTHTHVMCIIDLLNFSWSLRSLTAIQFSAKTTAVEIRFCDHCLRYHPIMLIILHRHGCVHSP